MKSYQLHAFSVPGHLQPLKWRTALHNLQQFGNLSWPQSRLNNSPFSNTLDRPNHKSSQLRDQLSPLRQFTNPTWFQYSTMVTPYSQRSRDLLVPFQEPPTNSERLQFHLSIHLKCPNSHKSHRCPYSLNSNNSPSLLPHLWPKHWPPFLIRGFWNLRLVLKPPSRHFTRQKWYPPKLLLTSLLR